MSEDFDALWKSSVRFRHASRELEPLLRELHGAFGDPVETRRALEDLLTFLAGSGRTDANCETIHYFTNARSEEHTSELQSQSNLVCRLLLEKKKKTDLHLGIAFILRTYHVICSVSTTHYSRRE